MDILEQLRREASKQDMLACEDMLQAADEIERLRQQRDALLAENEDLRRWKALDRPLTAALAIANSHLTPLRAESDDLRQQRDALLAALKNVLNYYAGPDDHGGDHHDDGCYICAAIKLVEGK